MIVLQDINYRGMNLTKDELKSLQRKSQTLKKTEMVEMYAKLTE